MPDLIGFGGQVMGFGGTPSGAAEPDLDGLWSPSASSDYRKQVVRGVVGQKVVLSLSPADNYTALAQEKVLFFLQDDPDEPPARECQVGQDNVVTITIPASTTAGMEAKTHRWELWTDDYPRPIAAGMLILSDSIRE